MRARHLSFVRLAVLAVFSLFAMPNQAWSSPVHRYKAYVSPAPPKLEPVPPEAAPPVSSITLSVKTPWAPLVSTVDSAIPKCGGIYQGDDNSVCLGTEATGNFIIQRENAHEIIGDPDSDLWFTASAWRWNTVGLSIRDGFLDASLIALYHLKVGLNLGRPLPSITASCGYGEPARYLFVGVHGQLRFNPDWFFEPDLAPSVHHALGRPCTVTIFNKDMSGTINGAIEKVLGGAIAKIRGGLKEHTNIRSRAAEAWAVLNKPIKLASSVWLTIYPQEAVAGLPTVDPTGTFLTLSASLRVNSALSFGAMPRAGTKELPALGQTGLSPDFIVQLYSTLTRSGIGSLLTADLKPRRYALRRPNGRATVFHVRRVEAFPSGSDIVFKIMMRGGINGDLFLIGKPTFVPETNGGAMKISSLTYTSETIAALHRAGYLPPRPLMQMVLDHANWTVSREFQRQLAYLKDGFKQSLAPGYEVEAAITRTGPGSLLLESNGITASYPVVGRAALTTPALP